MFHMPTYRDLSDDQELVYNLPLTGRYLVTGPPGTGKTVMALLRAQALANHARQASNAAQAPVFLVYSKVLQRFLQQALVKLDLVGTASTYYVFFRDWFPRQFRQPVPHRPDNKFSLDWDRMLAIAQRHDPDRPRLQHLIVDEGQDFPVAFYQFIALIAEHVTIFADDNQTIHHRQHSASIQDIQLVVVFDDKLDLTTNFRNSRPIAELSSCFYVGTVTGKAALPDRLGPVPRMIHYPTLDAQAEAILLYEQTKPRTSIGVLTDKNPLMNALYDRLEGRTVNPLRRYQSGIHWQSFDFHRPGIIMLNYQSAKGLEFDVVILPGADQWFNCNAKNDRHRMALYVQTSRPRHDLRVLHSARLEPGIFADVPDSRLLRHRTVAVRNERGA